MLKLSFEDEQVKRNIRQLAEKDVRRAAAWSLNDTAQDVLDHMQSRMDQVFDRPTRFTKNALMVWRAKPNKLEAEVIERPSVGSRHYLKVQEIGGRRGQTGLEKLLGSRLAYDGVLQAAVPASGAKLDAYGNWSTGERNQALSGVRAQRDGTANTTDASRRRNRRRAGFFVPKPGSRLSPGIWKRDPDGSISKVLHFSAVAPVYSERLGFQDGAERLYAERMPEHFARILDRMVQRLASGA
ncbi:hypothetical protein [Paracoccus bogoriensis]|uniref:hypothetical protein n=1 Tax=Paracoccus bogoriensis TaxID=242065 RepID=UPI001FE74AF1|nr:hypothetical protein [Paracoccus bogoriensis]